MITDDTRIVSGSSRSIDVARAYLSAIEADDIGELKRMMHPNVRGMHANYPDMQGRDEVASLIQGYRRMVRAVDFEVRTIFGGENIVAIEKVNVAQLDKGVSARIPVMTVLEFDGDERLVFVRVYADVTELYRKLESVRTARTS